MNRRTLYLGIGLSYCHCTLCGFGNVFFGYLIGSGKAPATIGNNTDTHTIRFSIGNALYAILAGRHELVQVTANAYISIAGPFAFCGIKSSIGQAFLQGHVYRDKHV